MYLGVNMKTKKGFTLIELLVVIGIIGILATLGLGGFNMVRDEARKLQNSDKLRSLHIMLRLYAQSYGSYPSTKSAITRHQEGDGVRGFYALYNTGRLGSDNIGLLKPAGASVLDMSSMSRSRTLTIDDFHKGNIGWSYNSMPFPDTAERKPLISFQGVKTGRLLYNTTDVALKPVMKGGVLVLFTDSSIEWFDAGSEGKLDGRSLIKDGDWGLLQD